MSDASEIKRIRERVDRVLATRHDEMFEKVRVLVADVLAIDAAKVTPTASLIDELGAESIDFLDLVFRLESEYRVKIPRDGLLSAARAGLGSAFDEKGVLSTEALERLSLLMPEVPAERIAPGLRSQQVPTLFTAETFVRLVAWRLSEQEVVA
jgi:acyl carrier protein